MTTISGVTDQIGLSPQRFIQMFRDETGFTPKVFCRIRRFQQALDRMQGRKNVEWARVALDCGYFDQAHLINDFRSITGYSPTEAGADSIAVSILASGAAASSAVEDAGFLDATAMSNDPLVGELS